MCIATPSSFGPFIASDTLSPGVKTGCTSPPTQYSLTCIQKSPIHSKHALPVNRRINRVKETSILARMSSDSKDWTRTPRTCRVKDTSVLTKMTVGTVNSPMCKRARTSSPNYIRWSPVLSKHSIDYDKSPSHRKDTSVLAKFLTRTASPRVKHLSTLTTLSPYEFTRMTDRMCSPAHTNHSAFGIFHKTSNTEHHADTKQQKKRGK